MWFTGGVLKFKTISTNGKLKRIIFLADEVHDIKPKACTYLSLNPLKFHLSDMFHE